MATTTLTDSPASSTTREIIQERNKEVDTEDPADMEDTRAAGAAPTAMDTILKAKTITRATRHTTKATPSIQETGGTT